MITATSDIVQRPRAALDECVASVSHLYKSFGSNDVLVDFNLEIKKGESVVVLGKSGSGKSVLIKCMIGLLNPDKGVVELFGKDIGQLNENELDVLRSSVGFLFQSNALYDSMTVRENLEFPLRRSWMKFTPQELDQHVTEALKDVGLSHTIDLMPAELSGGMRKRIALARTLILKPEIIFYDEPTTGLDPVTGKEIIELMISIHNKYKSASLIITHDVNCVKMAGDRVMLLMNGKCYASGTYAQLRSSADENINQFFQ
jgi:phospholipid/cholesterol/gamma-HCH transport system ATP-binding protein